MPSAKRVLIYGPGDAWTPQAMITGLIARAFRFRGSECSYVLCDGLFKECDSYRRGTNPRPADGCLKCQASVASVHHQLQNHYQWLGRYVQRDDCIIAAEWSRAVPDDKLLTAEYGQWKIGRWSRGSIHCHMRVSSIDFNDPAMITYTRSWLYSNLLACLALDRLLADSNPDLLLMFNGAFASTRIAYELAMARGIRTICLEMNFAPDQVMVTENEHAISTRLYGRAYEHGRDIPLLPAELDRLNRILTDRLGSTFFTDTRPELFNQLLAPSRGRPLWVVFNSSDDEGLGIDALQTPFETQGNWLKRTFAFAREHPEIFLILRCHPNSGGRKSHGVNHQLLGLFEELRKLCAENVAIVEPDGQINSYALMHKAALCLTFNSTIGLEAACQGKPVLTACPSMASPLAGPLDITDPSQYETLLTLALPLPADASFEEQRRRAFRYVNSLLFRHSFTFEPVRNLMGQFRMCDGFSTFEQLADPNQFPEIERFCRFALDGAPLLSAFSPAERNLEAETAWLRAHPPQTGLVVHGDWLEGQV